MEYTQQNFEQETETYTYTGPETGLEHSEKRAYVRANVPLHKNSKYYNVNIPLLAYPYIAVYIALGLVIALIGTMLFSIPLILVLRKPKCVAIK